MCFSKSILKTKLLLSQKMLSPIEHILKDKRIVLASGSPRRQELIKSVGLKVELCPSLFEENLNLNDFTDFEKFIEATAEGKAEEVYKRLSIEQNVPLDLVIAADTMVTVDDLVFGKPKDSLDAFRMLKKLNGNCNTVYTGVILKHPNGIIRFTDKAKVYFGIATDEQIQAYIDTGDPLDKAGSYGINGIGGAFIEKIEGDYYTVMGLPLHRLCIEICKLFGYEQ